MNYMSQPWAAYCGDRCKLPMGKYWFDQMTKSKIIRDQKLWSLKKRPKGLIEFSDRPYFPDGPISWEIDGLNFNHHRRELPPASKKIIRDTEDNHATLIHKGGFKFSKSFIKNGKFCELRKVFWKPAKTYVALKTYTKAELSTRIKKDILNELTLLRKFKHMYILAYFGVIETKWKMYHVFEWMHNGHLLEYLKNQQGPLEFEMVQKMFAQLVSAVSFIHDSSYVHRDIKLENILVGKKGDIRLSGFRHAISGFAFNKNADNTSWPKTTAVVGAILYISPEALIDIPFNAMLNDVWAMGVILFALLFRKFPFHNTSRGECARLIRTGFSLPKGRPCPQEAKDVLEAIFSREAKRIRSYQLPDMPWLSGQKASKSQRPVVVQAKDAMKQLNKVINAGTQKSVIMPEEILKENDLARLRDADIKEKHALLCKAQSKYDLFSHVRPDYYFNIPPQLWGDFAALGEEIDGARIIRTNVGKTKNNSDTTKHMKRIFEFTAPLVDSDSLHPSYSIQNEELQRKENNVSTLFTKADFGQKLISQVPSVIPM